MQKLHSSNEDISLMVIFFCLCFFISLELNGIYKKKVSNFSTEGMYMPFSQKVIKHHQTTGFLKADPLQIDNETILVTMLSARWLRNLALNDGRDLPCNTFSVFPWIRSQTEGLTQLAFQHWKTMLYLEKKMCCLFIAYIHA